MAAVLIGDREAFAKLYQRHGPAVHRLCQRLIPDPQRAEDAFTDAFLNALRKAHTWTPKRPVRPWLLRIARNRCLNLRRDEQRRRTLSLDASAGKDPGASSGEGAALGARLSGNETPPPERVARQESLVQLREAMAQLPDSQREVIEMRMFDGLSCAEIGQVLDCKVGTVWSRIHNAMESLRVSMEKEEKSS